MYCWKQYISIAKFDLTELAFSNQKQSYPALVMGLHYVRFEKFHCAKCIATDIFYSETLKKLISYKCQHSQ